MSEFIQGRFREYLLMGGSPKSYSFYGSFKLDICRIVTLVVFIIRLYLFFGFYLVHLSIPYFRMCPPARHNCVRIAKKDL